MAFATQFANTSRMKVFCLLIALALTTPEQVLIHTKIKSIPVRVAFAMTQEARAQGLMGVKDLQNDQGMLFVYPQAALNRFWMKNTPTSLDIVFIASDKKIVYIAKSTVPFSEETIDPEVESQFVLEVKAGFVDREHISVGDSVAFQMPTTPKP